MNVQASILLPAGAAVGVALPRACDHVSREFQPVGRRAYRAASHSRWRCASERCCSDPRRFESNARRLPWLAACPAGCTPILAAATRWGGYGTLKLCQSSTEIDAISRVELALL